jgi:hypothetical protein
LFAGFDPGGSLVGTEGWDAQLSNLIGQAERKWFFWPDDHEVDLKLLHRGGNAIDVVDFEGQIAFPGVQKSSVVCGDCANFQQSACSRAPLPTTRIFKPQSFRFRIVSVVWT